MAIWKRLRTALFVLAALLVLVVVVSLRAGDDPPRVRFLTETPAGTQQVVVVEAPNTGGSLATVSLFEPDGAEVWVRVKGPYGARIGTSGFRDPAERSEGDGSTPIGMFSLPSAFGGGAAPGGTALPYTQIGERGHCWISDPNSQAYNRWVLADPCTVPNVDLYAATRPEERYFLSIVIGFNVEYRRANAGSALFLHATSQPTELQATGGGVALDIRQLRSVLSWLDPAKNPVVFMGPESKIGSALSAPE